MGSIIGRFGEVAKKVYSPRFIALNAAIAVGYWFLITRIISYQQLGIVLYTVPSYLIYILAISSSVLLTIAIYSALDARKRRSLYSCGVSSAGTAFLGGIFGGCGCQGALFYSGMAAVLGGGDATLLDIVVGEHVKLVFLVMILANIVLIFYSIARLDKNGRKVRRR